MRVGLFGFVSILALGSAFGAAAAATAEGPAVDPVTVIGTRTARPASEVPATVSVIAAEQIADQLAADIKDIVRYEPGVSVRSSPARFGAAQGTTGRDGESGFNIRGLEGNRVLIQEDGIRTPDAFSFGAQSVGRGDYQDLDVLKSVEILRGPASALYGSDGVAGAVSFTTKNPGDVLKAGQTFGGLARAGYASADDSAVGTVLGAWRQGAVSGLLAYTRRDGHEQETRGSNDAANTDRTTANPQDIQSNSVLGKLVLEPAEGQRLRLTGEHFDRHLDTSVLSGIAKPPLGATSVLGLTAADTTKRDRVSVDYRYEPASGPVSKLTALVYGQASTTEQFTAEDRNTAADRTRRNSFDNRVIGASLELESRFVAGGVANRLIYGGDISRTRQTGLRDGTVPPAGETFPTRAFPNTDYTLVGVFAQDEIALLDGRLTLYPALRYDHYDLNPHTDALVVGLVPAASSGGRVSPKFGAVLKVTPTLNLFLNAAEGFKAPAPSQVNNAFSNPIQNYRSIPNPGLRPETSQTVEGGARWTSTVWSAGVTAFAGEYRDFIDQALISGAFSPTNPGVFQFVNLGRVKIQGLEAQGRLALENGFGGFVAASYAHGETTSTAGVTSPLDSIDPVKVVAGVSYRADGDRWGGEVTATHSDGKAASRVSTAACTGACFTPHPFTTLDVTAHWRVTDQITARAGVFNLGDQKYWWWNDVRGLTASAGSRDAYTQPGRNASVSLAYAF